MVIAKDKHEYNKTLNKSKQLGYDSFVEFNFWTAFLGCEGGRIFILPVDEMSCLQTYFLGTRLIPAVPGITVAIVPIP